MTYVALLRAINAGVKLPMADLRRLAAECGFEQPRTYIASGNLLFDSPLEECAVKRQLEEALLAFLGKPVAAMIRTGAELARVAKTNPFAAEPNNQVAAIFFDELPPASVLTEHRHRAAEQIALGERELYVFYPEGMGQTRLVIPAAVHGTARSLNTVAKLAELAGAG